jgi:hypothetical protein
MNSSEPFADAPASNTPTRVEIVHDLEVGDYLPDYHDTVKDVQIITERFGAEYVTIELAGGRAVVLDGLEDIEVA